MPKFSQKEEKTFAVDDGIGSLVVLGAQHVVTGVEWLATDVVSLQGTLIPDLSEMDMTSTENERERETASTQGIGMQG